MKSLFNPEDGNYQHLNACVGENSGGIAPYAYMQGFLEAFYALSCISHANFYINPVTREEKSANVDGLIYPMLYCARHYIELFLKYHYLIVSNIKNDAPEQPQGHKLTELFNLFKTISAFDRRLVRISNSLEPFIDTFDNLDPTGQTFRYAQDKKGDIHLSGVALINANGLTVEFQKLHEVTEPAELEIPYIAKEYLLNTCTKHLSRYDISVIAENLPAYSTWGNPDFKQLKEKVKRVYGIGSAEFSDVIDIIKKHREFSLLIGLENKINELSFDLIRRLKDASADNTSSLNEEEWKLLYYICEMGRVDYYSEQFETMIAEDWGNFLSPQNTFERLYAKNYRFHIGLIKLGQKSAISFISEDIPLLVGNTEEINYLTRKWKV